MCCVKCKHFVGNVITFNFASSHDFIGDFIVTMKQLSQGSGTSNVYEVREDSFSMRKRKSFESMS